MSNQKGMKIYANNTDEGNKPLFKVETENESLKQNDLLMKRLEYEAVI